MADNNINLNVNGIFNDQITPGLNNLLTGGISNLTGALGGLAAAFSISSMAQFVNDAIQAGDALDELSQKTGTTVEQLSELALVTKVEGMGPEGLAQAYKKLSQALVEAQDSTKDASYAFKSMGIATTDSAGNIRNVQDVMYELADVFSNTQNDAYKVSAAMQLMGKSGTEMIPMLNNGADALRAMNETSKEFGLDWTTEQAAQAAEFNDNINVLKGSFDGLWQTVAKDLLPVLLDMAKYMAESAKEGGTLRAVLDGTAAVVEALFIPVKALADAVAVLSAAFNIAGHALGGFSAAAAALMDMDFSGAKEIMKATGDDIQRILNDYQDFSDKLWTSKGGETPNSAALKEEKKTIGDLGAEQKKKDTEAEKSAEKQAKAQEKLNEQYNKAVEGLGKQLFALKNTGQVAETTWQTSFGAYKDFSDAQKETLIGLAREIDLQTQLNSITTLRFSLADRLLQLTRNTNQSAQLALIEPETAREASRLILDYKNSIEDWKIAEERRIDKIADANQRDKERAELLKEVKRLMDPDMVEAYKKDAEAIAELNTRTEVWTRTILDNRDAHSELIKEEELLGEWLAKGAISVEEYNNAMEKNTKKQQELWKNQSEANRQYYDLIISDREQTDKLHKSQQILNDAYARGEISLGQYNMKMKQINDQLRNIDTTHAVDQLEKMDGIMKQAAGSFEGMFSDYIFEGMQGNWENLGDSVKKIIDRMIANMIAAQLQMMIFGDVAETPYGKQPASTGVLGGIFNSGNKQISPYGGGQQQQQSSGGFWSGISDFFGGFFANGGDVNPNKFYMVGERGPELFRPNSSGRIVPNDQLNSTANININISALDGGDVMRVLNSRRREISELVSSTSRQYNLNGV